MYSYQRFNTNTKKSGNCGFRFFILFFILLILCIFNENTFAQNDALSHYPEYPLQVIGMHFRQLLNEKTGGDLEYGVRDDEKTQMHISYNEYWFGWKEPVKTEYCLTDSKVSQLVLHFATKTIRNELIRQINIFLGTKGVSKKIAGASTEFAMYWIKSGLMFSLQDYGSYMEMYITLASIHDEDIPKLPKGVLLLAETQLRSTKKVQGKKIQLAGIRFDSTGMFFRNFYLITQDEGSGKTAVTFFPSKYDGGYSPLLQLIDFTGDNVPEVFVTVPTGSSGGITNYFVYSITGSQPECIFSPEPRYQLSVSGRFEKEYKASMLLMPERKSFTVNLLRYKQLYDEMKVYKNGALEKPVSIWISGYVNMTARDVDNDGIHELKGIQQIKGITNSNDIADAVSYWKWKDKKWQLIKTEIITNK